MENKNIIHIPDREITIIRSEYEMLYADSIWYNFLKDNDCIDWNKQKEISQVPDIVYEIANLFNK